MNIKAVVKKIKNLPRVFRKVIAGESILILKRDKHHWDGQFKQGKWDFLLQQPQYHLLIIAGHLNRLSKQKPHMSVLDVGCGNGALARELNLEALSYTGTDISEVALGQAKEQAPKGKFLNLSMTEDVPLREKFDVIVFSEVLYYGEYEDILNHYRKYLKSNGTIVISLYDSWRTKIIWQHINKYVSVVSAAAVKDEKAGTRWRIKVATFLTPQK